MKDKIRKGMNVRLANGKSLGRVTDIESKSFICDGASDKVDYIADFDQVADIRGDDIILMPHGAQEQYAEERQSAEGRVALNEEQLDVSKRVQQAGEARLRKRVITERKVVDVPVMHEELRVERVAGTGAPAANATFKEETVSIPLQAEEVEVTKRPVVREEVVVRKERVVNEQRVAADIRHEELEIDESRQRSDSDEKGGYRGPGGSENL